MNNGGHVDEVWRPLFVIPSLCFIQQIELIQVELRKSENHWSPSIIDSIFIAFRCVRAVSTPVDYLSCFRNMKTISPGLLSTIVSITMWTTLCIMLLGLAACCVSLPQVQYVNDKPYHLMQSTECRGGKVYEINQVQDIDECKAACLHRNCRAVNLFQVGEFEFKCEILAYVRGYQPAQGAACYVSYY
ncbi:hypothetical protein Ddc_01721 [Ditylenchus destructor]|nr:hypothetical protein Ddc_01721 [Ditylenchus destructor]